jgi:hypothetical protein
MIIKKLQQNLGANVLQMEVAASMVFELLVCKLYSLLHRLALPHVLFVVG